MPFFSHKKTSPEDIVNDTVDSIKDLLNPKSKQTDKKKSDNSPADSSIGVLNSKFNDANTNFDTIAQLCHLVYSTDLIVWLVKSIPYVGFETRKDITQIIGYLMRRQVGSKLPTVDYILSKPEETVFALLKLYENRETSQTVGIMLRDLSKSPQICRLVLFSPSIYDFFKLITNPVFDIATDCFLTFHDILLGHPQLCAEFLNINYDEFFQKLHELVNSDNYVSQRQSLKIIREILFEHPNHAHMIKYLSSTDNLKIIMNLLHNKSLTIKHEAFSIFKLFVANPNKTPPIISILKKNKVKLIEYLENFPHNKDNETDDETLNEKNYLIKTISDIPD